jgi:hypothetical protein
VDDAPRLGPEWEKVEAGYSIDFASPSRMVALLSPDR